jgi:hypothetical protein
MQQFAIHLEWPLNSCIFRYRSRGHRSGATPLRSVSENTLVKRHFEYNIHHIDNACNRGVHWKLSSRWFHCWPRRNADISTCLLQTLKWRRLTIYGEPYARKISAVDIFWNDYCCHAMWTVVMFLHAFSSINGPQYILSKFSQPIIIK